MGGGSEPIVGAIHADPHIEFDDTGFYTEDLSNIVAQFYLWSDVLEARKTQTQPNVLTIDELKSVIENGADVSATMTMSSNVVTNIDIPLHLDRMNYLDTNSIVLKGSVMDAFPSSVSVDGTGYAIYVEVGYGTSWGGKVVWYADVVGK